MFPIHCRLIIILTIFVWLTLILAKVCPYSRTITEEFAREMKERHEEARAVLVRSQKGMKRQADMNRKEAE